jgi:hypothetical protein
MIWKEVPVAYLKLLSCRLRAGIDENFEIKLIGIAEPDIQHFLFKSNVVTSTVYNLITKFAVAVIITIIYAITNFLIGNQVCSVYWINLSFPRKSGALPLS